MAQNRTLAPSKTMQRTARRTRRPQLVEVPGRASPELPTERPTDRPGRPDPEHVAEWFARYRETGDERLRDDLVELHLGLAEHLARRFVNRGEPLADLIQVANIGLLKAVERFDPARGFGFSTYAVPTILGELKRYFRDHGWSVRVPRGLQELRARINSELGHLSQELGRSPTINEIAEYIGVDADLVVEATEAGYAYRSASLDAVNDDADESGPVIDRLGQPDIELTGVEDRASLAGLLGALNDRERAIIHLRFQCDLTQSEIAARLGLSQMHVSRLLARALDTLRQRAATNRREAGEINATDG